MSLWTGCFASMGRCAFRAWRDQFPHPTAMIECPDMMGWHGQRMAAYHRPRKRGTRCIVPARVGAFFLAILYCAVCSPATGDEQRRRIYFLESLAPTQPAAIRTIEAFKRRLAEKTSESFEIFIDYMELERFPGQAHIDRTVRYLQGKYAEAPPAVLIPLGRSAVPFILQSPWHVPIRWFVLFTDDERRLVEEEEGYRLLYRSTAAVGRQRVDEALEVIRNSELAPLVDLIGDLSRWLAAFDATSIVELDYGSVSALFSWDELDNDHSAREIGEALEALGRGDVARSAEIYQTVAGRWAEVRSHESLN